MINVAYLYLKKNGRANEKLKSLEFPVIYFRNKRYKKRK